MYMFLVFYDCNVVCLTTNPFFHGSMGSDVIHPGVKRRVAVVVSDVGNEVGSGSSGRHGITHQGVKRGVAVVVSE